MEKHILRLNDPGLAAFMFQPTCSEQDSWSFGMKALRIEVDFEAFIGETVAAASRVRPLHIHHQACSLLLESQEEERRSWD